MQLPLITPVSDSPGVAEDTGEASTTASTIASVSKSLPTCDGEVMLIDRGGASGTTQKPSLKLSHSYEDTRSVGSRLSAASRGSGKSNNSDADRLINAFQSPLDIGDPETDSQSTQRQLSASANYGPGHNRPKSDHAHSTSADSFGRPTGSSRSLSTSGIGKEREMQAGPLPATGLKYVTDSRTPIRPVKIADDYKELPKHPAQPSGTSGITFELGNESAPTASTVDGNVHKASQPKCSKLQVLVAEDDPINMKILRKRLEKAGHTVHHTVNGEECAQTYRGSDGKYDVVLMDMQVSFGIAVTAA